MLSAGMVAGFRAGTGNGHHIVNRSNAVVRLLEVGTRTAEETAHYSDIDMMYREDADTEGYFTTDGRPSEMSFSQDPGRQPRRDRLARHAHGQGDGLSHRRGLFRRRQGCPARCLRRRGGAHRPAARRRELSQHRPHPRGRAQVGRRCDPSRLRLPLRERGLCRGLREGRPGLHRPAARRHRRHGQQGGRQAAHDRCRRALRAGLSGRRPERRPSREGSAQDRPAGDGEGRRRRRRARHAAGRARRRSPRSDPHGAGRGRERLRLGRADPGEGRGRCPPRRDPGLRRRPRQRHPSRRARLLGAAPPSEGDRGSALARRERRPAQSHGGRRRRRRAHHRLPRRRHGRVPAGGRRRLLLPRDEHAPAGRASRDRGDHRPGPRRLAAQGRGRREAAAHPGAGEVLGPRHRSPPLCRGRLCRLPAADRAHRCVAAGRAARASASITA